jgi:hypothetical protein
VGPAATADLPAVRRSDRNHPVRAVPASDSPPSPVTLMSIPSPATGKYLTMTTGISMGNLTLAAGPVRFASAGRDGTEAAQRPWDIHTSTDSPNRTPTMGDFEKTIIASLIAHGPPRAQAGKPSPRPSALWLPSGDNRHAWTHRKQTNRTDHMLIRAVLQPRLFHSGRLRQSVRTARLS